ncbi:class I SAM-dependent DNA methyltransferase [Qingshengfaniella alkalisoli]|uniref:Class I SAM-dependent methyltransferase n=1 Tax=Qingshengfaniella alkalisoli TaxID=2599296 RepID=A0A5B8IA77_9RHOB|nr:class I SAM-dependent methyltransferase [Qingshengfaniella alkalisoli]QDY71335.1 class I SAM-dependent methyltransferase [Qingshengfaniella alkalisoli]
MQDDGFFDEAVAATYDDDEASNDPAEIERIVAWLAELAGNGPALEFAIGTGRIALPLARAGVEVVGIDLSRPMLRRLRSKPGGDAVRATIGDMTSTRLGQTFSLVYLVFNTINNLTTQAAQVACFENAAAHLEPGGAFLIEVGVPPLQRLPEGETLIAFELNATHWGVDEIDVVSQRFSSHHMQISGKGIEHRSIPFRYVWPSELDLMARLAGLTLFHRWGGWQQEPFTARSRSHVSVWRKSD